MKFKIIILNLTIVPYLLIGSPRQVYFHAEDKAVVSFITENGKEFYDLSGQEIKEYKR